jgi:hypothetical protein
MSRDIHMLPLTWPWRKTTVDSLETCTRSYMLQQARIWLGHRGGGSKWQVSPIRTSWQGACKRFGSMTIDNIKDQPDLPRTDDITVILQNFVREDNI